MTNGEKLIRDFPYIKIKGQDEVFTAIQIDTTGTGTPIIVYTEWWNSEYKEPTTKNDLAVDAISRKQAIDAFPNLLPNMGYNKKAITEILQEVPSVITPQEPKTGHWIEHPHEAGENWEYPRYECSECHVWADDDSDYCPNCGAKMGVEDGNDSWRV